MIYITEGLQIDGKSVSFINLRDLFEFFNACGQGKSEIIIKDVCLDKGCVLKALPIYIDEKDVPFLKKISQLKSILHSKVVFKIKMASIRFNDFKELILNTMTQVDLTGVTISLKKQDYEMHKSKLNALKNVEFSFVESWWNWWSVFVVLAFASFIVFLVLFYISFGLGRIYS